ncbi:hypothetical protein [Halomarina oriensis]|uniref:Uncharacterized protein n=1 Tax=Halomarina oriensis TaxID=671145 RepID=A0A6B0GNK1_9EURY|nr:hypothetical protein [Halomarina oriensis]MWG35089.1 hypothetical protein [Halomarina oriensis]
MSWLARTSVERPYVLAWVLFCCWLNGWIATGLFAVAAGFLPEFLVGAGIPRTLYANLVSLGLLVVFVLVVYAQVRAIRRWLPRLDTGRDTPRTRRLTALAALAVFALVPVVTDATPADPFSVVVLGVLPTLLVVEGVVVLTVGGGSDEPTANAG